MRSAALLACLLASCALPPRVDDRSTPKRAYETFRGAIARAEYGREWDCLSDGMRTGLGMRHRADWEDARAVVLTTDHILVRGICRSKVDGQPQTLPDGRVRLKLEFPLGYEGTVVMRSAVFLRAWVADTPEPVILQPLGRVRLRGLKEFKPGTDGAGVVVVVPAGDMRWIAPELRRNIIRFEVVREWFLDDFAAGDETPRTVRKDIDSKEKAP